MGPVAARKALRSAGMPAKDAATSLAALERLLSSHTTGRGLTEMELGADAIRAYKVLSKEE